MGDITGIIANGTKFLFSCKKEDQKARVPIPGVRRPGGAIIGAGPPGCC